MKHLRGEHEGKPFYYIPIPEDGNFIKKHKIIAVLLRVRKKVPQGCRILLDDFFYFTDEIDRFDYLYNVKELITLKGRMLHNKKIN